MSEIRKLRCAVYTRKSSEEGLDQAFNSLDAQREACVAYIASQASLGWRLVPDLYDDGGISGGTLERPGIQRLMQHIKDGKVDVVVVYKIDRLTRSLMDFAKLVDVFDAHEVSFVSITQQFNTTTSMGRLTLNVLLSFAQFEREVTAERIRDKVMASKRKGMWMGGIVPLGYRAVEKKLVVDQRQADEVRHMFKRYLELGSVVALVRELNKQRVSMEASTQDDDGEDRPGMCDPLNANVAPLSTAATALHSRGKIHYILSNPVYTGKIRHKGELHDGEHVPIIKLETFDAAQSKLKQKANNPRGSKNQPASHLLTGLLRDEQGNRLTPVHAGSHGRRYLYYVTDTRRGDAKNADPWRLAAQTLDPIVIGQLIQILKNRSQLTRWIQEFGNADALLEQLQQAARLEARILADDIGTFTRQIIRMVFNRITVKSDGIHYQIDTKRLVSIISGSELEASITTHLQGRNSKSRKQSQHPDQVPALANILQPITLKRRGVEMRIVVDDGSTAAPVHDETLITMIARAHLGLKALTDGASRSIQDAARTLAMDASDLSRILPLAFLSPKITDAILSGRQPSDLTLRKLTRDIDLPQAWATQHERLGV